MQQTTSSLHLAKKLERGGGVTMEGEEDVGKEKREGDGMMESES